MAKCNRILPKEFIEWLSTTNFANKLKEKIGEYRISDEEGLGYPNVYWRLVRPNNKADVGPLHCDAWFWEINNNYNEKSGIKKGLKFG